jgi:3-isopropylmalate/(R)-2-methylmalate dehydratase small subunit
MTATVVDARAAETRPTYKVPNPFPLTLAGMLAALGPQAINFGISIGAERPEFVLNRAPYRPATILVAAENFGCGSSREAAVWALLAYGIRCVIAPSLGDIFHQNCFKNGLLPVILPAELVAGLRGQLHARPGARVTADLEAQTVAGPDGAVHGFAIDAFARQMLLSGQDEIALTLGYEAQIGAFEARRRAEWSWLRG